MMWPGGEFAYQNVNPTFKKSWNISVTMTERIDTVNYFQISIFQTI